MSGTSWPSRAELDRRDRRQDIDLESVAVGCLAVSVRIRGSERNTKPQLEDHCRHSGRAESCLGPEADGSDVVVIAEVTAWPVDGCGTTGLGR